MKVKKCLLQTFIALFAAIPTIQFVPWNVVGLCTRPLPNSVQHQVYDAVEMGLDGVIVYMDEGGKRGNSILRVRKT